MAKFRVSRFLKRDIVVRVNFLNDRGIVQNQRRYIEFNPDGSKDGWYETNDKVLIESLKEKTEQLPFSSEVENSLKENNIDYTYAYCPSCGGKKVTKLQYNLLEVVE